MARRTPFGAAGRCPRWLSAGLLVTLALPLACRRTSEVPDACLPCSSGFSKNPKAQAQVVDLWRTVDKQVWKQGKLDLSCMCFGAGASTSVEGRNIELPAEWELREQTARAAHLALHRSRPPWNARSKDECAARVGQALEREAEAHELELEVRRALGVTAERYPFEPEYWSAPPARRRAVLLRYFSDHPQGDGAVPGFASQYRARCGALPG